MSERQKNAIVYRKLQYSNAYHNHCYKLKEILSIVTEITIKFSRYLNKKSKLSWEKKNKKKPWKDYKLLFVMLYSLR